MEGLTGEIVFVGENDLRLLRHVCAVEFDFSQQIQQDPLRGKAIAAVHVQDEQQHLGSLDMFQEIMTQAAILVSLEKGD